MHRILIDKYISKLHVNSFIDGKNIYNYPKHKYDDCQSTYAAYCGHIKLIKYYHNDDAKFTRYTMNVSVIYNNMDIIKWLYLYRKEYCDHFATLWSAYYDHLHILKWLHKNKLLQSITTAAEYASKNNSLKSLKWLYLNFGNLIDMYPNDVVIQATINNNVNILRWLHNKNHGQFTPLTMDKAVLYNKYDIIKWLYVYRNEKCSQNALNSAITSNYKDIVYYLCEFIPEKCDFNKGLMLALHYNNREIIDILTYYIEYYERNYERN